MSQKITKCLSIAKVLILHLALISPSVFAVSMTNPSIEKTNILDSEHEIKLAGFSFFNNDF
ncbi:MAG: hypothetical protein PUP46_07790 [Endozoicomonas sp. (ex Botrylloides leachii)]|nr:hypothetical protein [Endozoicomonas sp. (ex Botrylloides leachii)]